MKNTQQCGYFSHQGKQCPEKSISTASLCFWHDPTTDKTTLDIKERLEKKVQQGIVLCGYQLAGAKLDGIHLADSKGGHGTDLTEVNFKRASLYNAHLYRANLTNACLMKANLDNATLNAANLEGADLLGVSLTGAKMEHIRWGAYLHQENMIKKMEEDQAPPESIKQVCEETEEICRHLRKQCESHGLSRDAGRFFYKEMRFRRLSTPLLSKRRLLSWCFDKLCGYGEKPMRLISFSLLFITLCAMGYFMLGIQDGDVLAKYQTTASLWSNLSQFAECLYFSVVTFTTLGYGDITPAGIGRFIAAVEAFVGSFTIALYVVVFVRRMSH